MHTPLPVTVITPSIPERHAMLHEAIASVWRNTVLPTTQLVNVEACPPDMHPMAHLVDQRNHLAEAVETEWTATLDDDDTYLPSHFEAIAPHLTAGADVVWSWPVEPERTPPPWDHSREQLAQQNVICSNACIRTETLRRVHGWSMRFDPASQLYDGGPVNAEDWDLWLRLYDIGARFVWIGRRTWHYRTGHERMSNLIERSRGGG